MQNNKHLSVDQVAKLVSLHPKTIRRLIGEKKIKAEKFGGQWRISRDEIEHFTSLSSNTPADSQTFPLSVSAVLESPCSSQETAERISTHIMGALNSQHGLSRLSKLECQYDTVTHKLRVFVWSDTKTCMEIFTLVENIISTVSL